MRIQKLEDAIEHLREANARHERVMERPNFDESTQPSPLTSDGQSWNDETDDDNEQLPDMKRGKKLADRGPSRVFDLHQLSSSNDPEVPCNADELEDIRLVLEIRRPAERERGLNTGKELETFSTAPPATSEATTSTATTTGAPCNPCDPCDPCFGMRNTAYLLSNHKRSLTLVGQQWALSTFQVAQAAKYGSCIRPYQRMRMRGMSRDGTFGS
ncbi:hypothetical protein K402DRAFT_456438 [Aulographum hederae CBS 113979]|uniref:Uncharacterized protein n=1 Tax=Aulographum hederae CBS 113979 TaxID=1176131 RepID=A0A6G1GS08_9PEZI|nr:hypothetical protein K402DRAFT_456438 [Aulographum hederae CBS 113979]